MDEKIIIFIIIEASIIILTLFYYFSWHPIGCKGYGIPTTSVKLPPPSLPRLVAAMTCENGGQECSGCMGCLPDSIPPTCPVCGNESDTFYFDRHDEAVGCGECIRTKNAWEVDDIA